MPGAELEFNLMILLAKKESMVIYLFRLRKFRRDLEATTLSRFNESRSG